MIINQLISPFADERKNTAKMTVFLPSGEPLLEYSPRQVLDISLVQELKKHQSTTPRSEITVKVDNSNHLIDVSNPDSAVFKFEKKVYCEAFLSSVKYGAGESFVRKCRYFFDSFSNDETSATLKFVDAASTSTFTNSNMTSVISEIGGGENTTAQVLEGVKLETEFPIEYYVPADIAQLDIYFTKNSFIKDDSPVKIKDGLFQMASALTTKAKSTVYFLIDDDGRLTFKKQQTQACATITKKEFINYKLVQSDDNLICKVNDRGNILYQLGDIIQLKDGNKSFNAEIYKLHYKMTGGHLSSEWEGVVFQ